MIPYWIKHKMNVRLNINEQVMSIQLNFLDQYVLSILTTSKFISLSSFDGPFALINWYQSLGFTGILIKMLVGLLQDFVSICLFGFEEDVAWFI